MTDWGDIDWPVRTARLELRPATPEDAGVVFAYRSLPDAAQWGWRWPTDLDAFARDWVELSRSHLIVMLAGAPIGDLMLKVGDGWAQEDVEDEATGVEAELGYTLSAAHRGQGYAAEAVTAALDLAFGPLGFRRVTAGCFADNTASWRLLERVGMRREAHNRADSLHRDLGWLDGYVYAILAEEWLAREG